MISVCIPTLKRYDLLKVTIESAEAGKVVPDFYYVIDNGGKLKIDFGSIAEKVKVYRPHYNIGVAKSWNWFIKTVPEIRIICNDDLQFFPDTIEKLTEQREDLYITYPGGIPSTNSFSCFVIPDTVVANVGLFDTWISPNYAYYEDNDYHLRMKKEGCDLKAIEGCRLEHTKSSTMAAYSFQELEEHHRKFRLATARYQQKWGGLPGEETYATPFNRV